LLTIDIKEQIITAAFINTVFNFMNNILKITSSSFILLTSLLLIGCEEKEEIKQEATEVKQTLTQAWQDAKETGKEFKDESLTELIDETKALGNTLATEGKALSKDLVEQGKEMASDASKGAKKAADELAKKIKEQREVIESAN